MENKKYLRMQEFASSCKIYFMGSNFIYILYVVLSIFEKFDFYNYLWYNLFVIGEH